jgi:phosphatidylserine/phosphatidylglycerophosphate/cardiolipin synthase-like enzyme
MLDRLLSSHAPSPRRYRHALSALVSLTVALAAAPAHAADQVYFSSNTNVTSILVQYINQENVRLDISSWYLSEHAISIAIANRFNAGVKVRIIGDRAAIFEADPNTKAEYYWLANQGIPIRLRFNPTFFPEIDHWKAAIFVGQNVVEFGSGNFAPNELAPIDAHNYSDDSEMFTSDPQLVGAFKTKFDQIWNDTTRETQSIVGPPPYLKDWADACANEPKGCDFHSQYPNAKPMVINTARLEPDNPMPPDLYWGQGPDFNNRLVQEVNNENNWIDVVVYRLEIDNLTQALLAKHQAGVPVALIVDPAQYTNPAFPQYWLTHANIDKLWAAGVRIIQRNHAGVTHMKTLLTPNWATNASSNFSANWQRDHDYFVSAATKPAIHQAFITQFNAMWNNSTDFGPLVTTKPSAADISSPAPGASGVATNSPLVWNRAAWAVSYDVYLGTSPSSLSLVANVPAQMVQDPPTTYSWTPAAPLAGNTNYYWKVVSKTNATPRDPSMIASSSLQIFTTGAGAGGGGGGGGGGGLSPFTGTPAPIPGQVNGENFDNGGEGVAYHDSGANNLGGQYRQTGVDIEASSEGGFDIGWTAAGEWLNYTVNVASGGNYTVQLRVSSPGGATMHVGFNTASNVWKAVSIPATGGWQNWTTVSVPVTLGAGTQQMTVLFDNGGMNFRFANVTSAGGGGGGGGGGLSPFSGTPVALPGTVNAANFDNGGEGVAYHDTSAGNSGGQYRSTDVDIEASSEGGFDVGWTTPGEWLNYTVNVTSAGSRTVQLRVASPGGATLHVGFNTASNVWKTVSVPATGGWQTWTTVSVPVTLGAGTQQLTLLFDTGGMNLLTIAVN